MAMVRLSGVSRLDQLKIYTPIFIHSLEHSHKRELMLTDQAAKLLTSLRKLCVPDMNQNYFAFRLNVDTIKENELKVYGKGMVTVVQNLLDNDLAMPVFYLVRSEPEESNIPTLETNSEIGPIQIELAIVSYAGERVEEKYSFAFNSIAARSFVNLQNYLVDNYRFEVKDFFELDQDLLNTKPISVIRSMIEKFETPFQLKYESRVELIEYLEQGFMDSEIYFQIPIIGWIYFDTTDSVKRAEEMEPFFFQVIVPLLVELDHQIGENFAILQNQLSEHKFDELRPKIYLPQIEFTELVISILSVEEHPIVEFVKIFHLVCCMAEKISEEKAQKEAKQHFDILYSMLKSGDNFISRFLLIDQGMYSGHDRVLLELKNAEDIIYCEYYYSSSFYWIFLSKDVESACMVMDKIIENYYVGDHTLFMFETLMEKYPNIKKSFLSNKKFKSLYNKTKNIVYWKQVPFFYRLFRVFIGDEFPADWEKEILSKVKYSQMKVKYLPRKNKS
ncbi:hypothetical protein [Leptospira vanthielii]|uniref:Uncharacterized protein n=1 Tax=Leptospira vanthielii serovar Holland str. Waz Holland = ATCC 700522 TaxID=1218591 RepID=N1W5Z9_9LEPT|nr:hypothetical protein [Leptospira vanthielii]EMY71659.1 hypothetical protein LEP1GSC199_0523 [Leptospira vanthielii serovar Holland str. Waz Holland = ATCC 700522]